VQDRPTAVELLDALGAFMRDRSANARDRWERFQFQVAANSIAIIGRELQMEDGFMRLEWEGLDILLGAEAMPPEQPAFVERLQERCRDLAERIRAGEFDDREDVLLPFLWETVVNKVRIASPKEVPAELAR
jgi:hypothetical protein